MTLRYIVAAVIAYLLGSFSTGIMTARLFHGPDLHTVGSKNTGASNVLRTMGWKAGIITFLGDFLKAFLACMIGFWLTGSLYGKLLCGLLVILGHNWPVFFRFKGGKGVASSCGVMVSCFPVPAVIAYAVAIGLISLTKYISVGSMAMLTVFALLTSLLYSAGDPLVIVWAALLAALCVLRHRANIQRLLRGTENKFGHKI